LHYRTFTLPNFQIGIEFFGISQKFQYLRVPKILDMNAAVAFVHEQLHTKKEFPRFKAGDNVKVN